MTRRYHHLDAARGLLMILGIVYHAARVYGEGGWLVSDPASPAFDALALTLSSFRMPAFFLMSGFFAALTLGRHGPAVFVRGRTPRIVLPLVATLLTANVVQLYVLAQYHGTAPAGLEAIVTGRVWAGVPIDEWVSHLWFLVCLACYFAVAALVAATGGARVFRDVAARSGASALAQRPAAYLLLLPLANMGVRAVFWQFPVLYSLRPLITLDTIAEYVPYFVVGMAANASPKFYESLTRVSPAVVGVTIATGALALLPAPGTSTVARGMDLYGRYLWTWVAVYWVLVGFRATLDRPRPAVAALADAAYTIYLFHHLTVIVIAWWLIDSGLSVAVKFPLLILITFTLTLALHRGVIRRVPLLRLLFNGRTDRGGSSRQLASEADGGAAA
jgi:glucan biosynthesis protein C